MSGPHLTRLLEVVKQIESLSSTEAYSGIGKARNLPHTYASAARGVRFTATSGYNSPSPVELLAAKEMQGEFEAKYLAKGEEAKCASLIAISQKLEALRIELPHIAAKASIEIGVVARECKAEAALNPIGDPE